MSTHRLPKPWGRWLDRAHTAEVRFQGEALTAHPGDTLMSALMAHGRHLAARSPVLGRPRGPLTLSGLDAAVPVRTPAGPNQLADGLPVHDGLTAWAQTPDGHLIRPRGRVRRAFDRVTRRVLAPPFPEAPAHLATAAPEHLRTDVAVIGAGPAGLAAAAEAARGGASVTVLDDGPEPGGSLLTGRWGAEAGAGDSARERLCVELTNRSNVRLVPNARVISWDGPGRLTALRGGGVLTLHAAQVVAATGVLEQPMVMRGGDLPGVMTGGGVQRALRLWGVKPGERAVVCTVNPQGYATALDLHDAGVEVAAVLDLNEDHFDCPERRACETRGLRIMPGHTVHAANPDGTGTRLGSVVVDALADHEGDVSFATETLRCDLLAMSVGTAPLGNLPAQAGASLISDTYTGTFLVEDVPPRLHLAGGLTGAHDLDHLQAGGRHAGWAAAKAAGAPVGGNPGAPERERRLVDHPWPIFPHHKGGEIVDRDADLTVADVRAAAEAGFAHPELLKRATGAASGASQGRVSALHALRIAARAAGHASGGWHPPASRPPATPAPLTALASVAHP